jgi:hypothetical protein
VNNQVPLLWDFKEEAEESLWFREQ